MDDLFFEVFKVFEVPRKFGMFKRVEVSKVPRVVKVLFLSFTFDL